MNTSGSFSAQNFARLSDQVKKDLAAKTDWDATYSGCDLDVYLHPFSYEPLSGYPGEARSADQLRSAMGVKPETSPPTGAAIVASRLDTRCELYSNHVATHLIALLSIARLLDDGRKFNAVLYGADRSIPLAIPWTEYFNHAIYGESDSPIACCNNPGPDSATSDPSYQTSVVAPGEIEDRYRHHGTLQAFGYSMSVLGGLFNMAEIMKDAGIDAYGYRGSHRQSIEMATQYYACYGKHVGFKKTVTAANASACSDYQEYVGQLVAGELISPCRSMCAGRRWEVATRRRRSLLEQRCMFFGLFRPISDAASVARNEFPS